jgi:ABC-type Fe3+-siderophore transport system permease subunit
MGAGVAFVATPISVTVFASISRKDMGTASVLNSYLSVISMSVSLALVTTLLMHRIDVNSFYLASAITSGNPAFEQAVHATSPDIALAAAYGQMMRQAAMFAFNDVWYLMAFVLILLIICLPFMKRPQASLEDKDSI